MNSPLPIDAKVNRIGVSADRALGRIRVGEVRLTEKNAAEQERSVDGGELDLLEAIARLHVEKVIKKSFVSRDVRRLRSLWRGVHEAERIQRSLRCVGARHVAALDADRISSQRESHRCYTRETLRRPAIGSEPIVWIGTFPEPVERAALERVEKGSLPHCERRWRNRSTDAGDRRRRRTRRHDTCRSNTQQKAPTWCHAPPACPNALQDFHRRKETGADCVSATSADLRVTRSSWIECSNPPRSLPLHRVGTCAHR